MHRLILAIIFLVWLGIHVFFLDLNSMLSVADSFAYLKMSYYIWELDVRWLGSGWFGFLYALPVAFFQVIFDNPYVAAQYANIALFTWSAVLLNKFGSLYLDRAYVYLLLGVYFLSPSLLHYNIAILSENIYIPLFLWLCITIHKWWETQSMWSAIMISFIMALLYLTRGEAFIYMSALYLIFVVTAIRGDISFTAIFRYSLIVTLFFVIFISPYVYLLYTKTWEIGLTNKWASNLRQAELRWTQRLDDNWFEQAVAELTTDKHHLIAGFAWGMEYDTPSIDLNLTDYVVENKDAMLTRFISNQKRLYKDIIPKMLFWSQLKIYYDRYVDYDQFGLFLMFIFFPVFFILFGAYRLMFSSMSMVTDDRSFLRYYAPLFLVASSFFTLFFVLERYFIIFLPIAMILMCYGIQYLLGSSSKIMRKILYVFVAVFLLFHSALGLYGYYHAHQWDNEVYKLKSTAWIWINTKLRCENHICSKTNKKDIKKYTMYVNDTDFKILERFPIVTYYSGTKHRYITPYTDSLSDIVEYAKYNEIDLLVVDTMDFAKYRPGLSFLLDETKPHRWIIPLKVWKMGDDKVIIYKIVY